MEGDFRMAHWKGMGCCIETQTRVSPGLGKGWEGEYALYPPHNTAQCGVKSTHGRTRETIGGRAGAAGKFRQQRQTILGKHYYRQKKTH